MQKKPARKIHELFISFTYKENLVFVLVAYTDEEIDDFVKDFFESVKTEKSESLIHMGISSNQPGIYNQEQNFERSFSAMEMAQKQNENVLYYDKLSIYKILYAVKERSVLRSFYNDSIGLIGEV